MKTGVAAAMLAAGGAPAGAQEVRTSAGFWLADHLADRTLCIRDGLISEGVCDLS